MDWVNKPQNYRDLYGILQLLRGSHLNNFPLKTLKLGWVALHLVTFQLKCLDLQLINNKKPVLVLSRFCNFYNTPLPPPPQKKKNQNKTKLHMHCFRFLLGHLHVPGETANNDYVKKFSGKRCIMGLRK